ncbi:MAG: flagellar biosynthesis protein FliQ [Zhaonellaceae bacterium]|nr:flagellar biosynthesis protein FliQ [Clostridia bacterium]
MTEEFVLSLAREALLLCMTIAAPPLLLSLLVGLVISILQATTQIQEQTLTFVPKIVVVMLSIIIFGSWMLSRLVYFTTNLFNNLGMWVR